MNFVSLQFLLFIAVVLLLYFVLPMKIRWIVLLTGSYAFYCFSSGWLVLVLFAMTLIAYLTGLQMEKTAGKIQQKMTADADQSGSKKRIRAEIKAKTRGELVCGIVLSLLLLIGFKYMQSFASFLPMEAARAVRSILVPLGISFYTLQVISYMTDVYRGKIQAEHHLLKFMLYISYFPQIVQGPIPRYKQLADQLMEGHSFDTERFARGAMLMLWGYMKKTLIADRVAIPVNELFRVGADYSGIYILLAGVLYSIQVYADFSGGMDIVCGFSEIIGIKLEQNFRQPYFSTSIEDFWRRWHITLGSWMKDYVFYPLSLSKRMGQISKNARQRFGDFLGKRIGPFMAMFLVYFLVGLWHGPSAHYVAYGIWNGIFIVAGILLDESYRKTREKLGIREDMKAWRAFRMIRTFLICSVGRLFSRALSLTLAFRMLGAMFSGPLWIPGDRLTALGLDGPNWIVLIIAVILLLAVDLLHEREVSIRDVLHRRNIVFRWTVVFVSLFLILILGVYGPNYDVASFIYEQF